MGNALRVAGFWLAALACLLLGAIAVLGIYGETHGRHLRLTRALFYTTESGWVEARTAVLAYGALLISSVTALAGIFFGWRQDRRQARDLELKFKELQIKMLELQLKAATKREISN